VESKKIDARTQKKLVREERGTFKVGRRAALGLPGGRKDVTSGVKQKEKTSQKSKNRNRNKWRLKWKKVNRSGCISLHAKKGGPHP